MTHFVYNDVIIIFSIYLIIDGGRFKFKKVPVFAQSTIVCSANDRHVCEISGSSKAWFFITIKFVLLTESIFNWVHETETETFNMLKILVKFESLNSPN